MLKVDSARLQLDLVRGMAKQVGAEAELEAQLNYLDTYAEDGERGATRCVLYADFAPWSFAFVMHRRAAEHLRHMADEDGYVVWFNGGLIYSGPGVPADGSAPAFSVNLTPNTKMHEWHVHT